MEFTAYITYTIPIKVFEPFIQGQLNLWATAYTTLFYLAAHNDLH